MVRRLKILLVVLVALWGILGAVGNVADWGNTTAGVATVASMSASKGGPFRWRATSNVAIVTGGALFIALSKAATGVLCLMGATKMWRALKGESQQFQSTKEFAIAGCVIAEVLLFGGFVVIAEGWYEMWRSGQMVTAVGDAAFRYGATIMLISIFVNQTD